MESRLDEDAARRARWEKRKREMRRRKQRQAFFRKLSKVGIVAALALAVVLVMAGRGKKQANADKEPAETTGAVENADEIKNADGVKNTVETESAEEEYMEYVDSIKEMEDEDEINSDFVSKFTVTEDTLQLGSDIVSDYAVFIDMESGEILACKNERSRIVPASMTKVLTLLVAVENIDNLDDKFEITTDIIDYCLRNDCINAGFESGETVTIKDLLYGAILPSGADAALGLAVYVSGSQEEFVKLMNAKLEELGLSETAHFTNCVGIYEADHYCTSYDMAVIMQAAVKNKTCREVLSAHTYTTSATEKHPEGILLSNWFLRRIEDKDTGGEVLCGKTGYVDQSGHCAVSCGIDKKGREYICVTAKAVGRWRCIEDHAYLYKKCSQMQRTESQ